MGILRNILGKKKMSKYEFAEGILQLQSEWAKKWTEIFRNTINVKGNEIIEVEANILALFILTISIPNNNIRDIMHDKFCEGLANGGRGFLEYLSSNYEKYFQAFNVWQKNPQQGSAIPRTIIAVLNDSVEDEISLGMLEEPMLFAEFMEMFKSTLGFIKKVKDDYEVDGL